MNARFGDLGKRFTTQNQCGMMERLVGASHLPGQPNRNGSYEDHVMASKALPSPEVLRQLLRYEPETGKLFWRHRPASMFKFPSHARIWNDRFDGKEISAITSHGYVTLSIFDKQHAAHRICFAIYYGKYPENQIDHINGVRSDNRILNLREVTGRENAKNRKTYSRNATGVNGVSLKSSGKYVAYINGRDGQIYLGSFNSLDEASSARALAEASHGYSPNHGRPE